MSVYNGPKQEHTGKRPIEDFFREYKQEMEKNDTPVERMRRIIDENMAKRKRLSSIYTVTER